MKIKPLSNKELKTALTLLKGWSMVKGKLYRKFEFGDFLQAFSFMTQAAMISEKLDHHPEWSNVYNKVEVFLSTHECNGVSARDVEWAKRVQALA
jgi:4a-hydroxytetrahydrobiopterin dehydratase